MKEVCLNELTHGDGPNENYNLVFIPAQVMEHCRVFWFLVLAFWPTT